MLESREENPSRNQREQPKLSTPISSTSTKKKTSSSAPLLLPHLTVRDVSCLDWRALAAAGFRAAVFDKDNTLTAPYSLELTAEATAATSAGQQQTLGAPSPLPRGACASSGATLTRAPAGRRPPRTRASTPATRPGPRRPRRRARPRRSSLPSPASGR